MSRWGLCSVIVLAVVCTPAVRAQWLQFVDQSSSRMTSDPSVGLADQEEKDYAWGDIDKDGDTDLICVRKEPFTSPGKRTNVLFINEGGVLVDRTSDFATDSSVDGDNGFLTPTNDRDVILVDLDLDGWLDMVTAVTISDGDPKYIGHPRIYMNKGCNDGGTEADFCTTEGWRGFYYDEPRIPAMLSYTNQSGFNPRFCSVSAGDVSGDGYPDLYFGDYDSSGVSGGSPQPPGADYNDKLLINQGAGNPGYFTDVTTDPARFQGTVPGAGQSFEVSAFGAANAIRDINGDLRKDIVKQTSLQPPTYVGFAYNDSTPNLGYFDTYDNVYSLSPYFVSVGDLNNDNDLDLVITDDGDDRYLTNQGGGFVPDFYESVFTFSHSGGGGGPSEDDGFGSNSLIVDLNKDGWNDVLIADVDVDIEGCGRRMHIYRNLGGEPGSIVNLQEQTTGSGCEFFQSNPPTCLVASIPADKLEGVHDVAVFDLNGDTWNDLVVGRCESTEIYLNLPPGDPAGGIEQYDSQAQLRLDKAPDGDITLSWGASCLVDDTDYAVYTARIFSPLPFQGHAWATCSTGGASTFTLTPASYSSYYLVVPNNGSFEGSYGLATGGPRNPSTSPCFTQNVGTCH